MDNSNAVSLDTVMIKIESDSGKSTSNIDKLATSLNNLKNAIKGGFNGINKLAGYLDKLNESATGLNATSKNLDNLASITDNLVMLSTIQAPTGLNKTIQRLNELSTTSKKVESISTNLESVGSIVETLGTLGDIKAPSGLTSTVSNLERLSKLSGMDSVISEMQKVPQLVEPLSKLGDIVSPKGMQNAISNLEKLPDVLKKIDATTLENLKRVSSELATSLAPLAEMLGRVADGYTAFSKIQNTFGKSASTVYRYMKQHKSILSSLYSIVRKVSSSFSQMGKNISSAFGKKALSDLKKFHSKFKQIFLSLLGTRTLFTMIRKAVSEYQAFDTSLQKFSQNVWRAFGAQLAPVIEYVMNLFKQFVRVIYSVVYALTGIDLIARANERAMQSWGDSAKDTLGNLQKFDDLNVVEFSDKAGDENELIDMDKIDLSPIQEIIDAFKLLKEEIFDAFKTGKWKGVGKALANIINKSFNLINIDIINNKLQSVGENFGDIMQGVLEELDFKLVGTKLSGILKSVINMFSKSLSQVDWSLLGEGLIDFFLSLDFSGIIDTFDNLFSQIYKSFTDFVIGLNGKWNEIKQEASEIGKSIGELFNSALIDLNWIEITKAFTEGINSILIIIKTTLTTFEWDKFGKNIADSINTFFKTFNFKDLADSITQFVHGLFTSLNTFVEELDWADIGEKIVKFILDIDWTQLALDFVTFGENLWKGIKEGIKAGSKSLVEMIFGGDDSVEKESYSLGERIGFAIKQGEVRRLLGGQDPISQFLGYTRGLLEGWIMTRTKESPTVMGEDIGNGITDGMVDSFGSIWNKSKPSFSSFAKSLLLFFGIHSPSTWARDNLGKNIVLGMVNGLSNIWKNSKSTFDTFVSNMNSKFSVNNFKSLGQNIVSGIRSGLSNLNSTVSSIFKSVFNGVIDIINGVSSRINSTFSLSISSTLSNALGALGTQVKSGWYQLLSISKIPKLETGTNEIPREGLYHLHPGEAVVPKKYNPALGNGGSDEMNEKLDRLIDIMDNLSFTNIVNVGNEKLYEKQQSFNKRQQNKYGTINI